MNFDEALKKYAHVGVTYDGGWTDKETRDKGARVLLNSAMDKFVAEEGLRIVRQHSDYDSGFEAGVLASEQGLGRYDG